MSGSKKHYRKAMSHMRDWFLRKARNVEPVMLNHGKIRYWGWVFWKYKVAPLFRHHGDNVAIEAELERHEQHPNAKIFSRKGRRKEKEEGNDS